MGSFTGEPQCQILQGNSSNILLQEGRLASWHSGNGPGSGREQGRERARGWQHSVYKHSLKSILSMVPLPRSIPVGPRGTGMRRCLQTSNVCCGFLPRTLFPVVFSQPPWKGAGAATAALPRTAHCQTSLRAQGCPGCFPLTSLCLSLAQSPHCGLWLSLLLGPLHFLHM